MYLAKEQSNDYHAPLTNLCYQGHKNPPRKVEELYYFPQSLALLSGHIHGKNCAYQSVCVCVIL